MADFSRFRHAIATRLVLLVAVVALPLLGLQAYNAIEEARTARADALDRSLQVARAVRERIDDHIHNVDALLVAIAASVPLRRDGIDAGNATLHRIREGLPVYFGSISLIEPDGTMLHSAESPPPKPGSVSVADRSYFREAVSSDRLAVGDPVVSRTSGRRIVVFARAIRDDGAGPLRGVVSVSTRLDRFQDIFSGIELPPGSVITVMDRRGVVLARSMDPEKWVGKDISNVQSVREALDQGEGTRELLSADGITRLSAFTLSRLAPWMVYVGIPSDAALATSQVRQSRNLGLMLLVAVLAIGAATWIARGIARPLRRLAGDAAELARGNLSHRSALTVRGEVGELAGGFNAMAASLEAQRSQLRESEARIRNLFEQAADGIFIITPDHRYLDANAEGLRMLGYSREELLGLHVWDVLAEHERPRLAAEVATMMAGTPHLAEWEHLRKDGTTFPAEVSARAHSPGQYLAIVRDLTQRREAEAALREIDLFRRVLFESSPVGLALCRMDGSFVECNPAFARILGRTVEETLSLSYWQVTPEKYAAEEQRQLDNLARNGRYGPYEKEYIHRNGHPVPVRLTGLIIEWKGERLIWSAVEDITEREELRARIERILENISDGFVALDRNWRYTYVNAKAGEMIGRAPASLFGRHIWTEFPEGVGQPFHLAYERAMASGQAEVLEEYYAPWDRWFENHIYPSAEGISIFFHEITERKHDEARLRDSAIRLETLSRKLMQVQEDERRALARELHDEVGQSLTALKLNLAALRRWFSEEAKLAVLDDSIGLVEDTIGRIRDRSLDLRPPMLDDVGLAGTLQWYASRLAKRSGLDIVADIAALPERPAAEAESAAFRIAQEALTNVLRHAGARRAEIHLTTEDGSLFLAVRDDGRGFDPAAVRPGETGGAGLVGMRERAGLLGGELVVDSSPGRGTEIRLRLPLQPAKPDETTPMLSSLAAPRGGVSVASDGRAPLT